MAAQVNEPVRVFDGAVLTVRIPMTFRRRGGRKLILVV
jgi:hypothetical protein